VSEISFPARSSPPSVANLFTSCKSFQYPPLLFSFPFFSFGRFLCLRIVSFPQNMSSSVCPPPPPTKGGDFLSSSNGYFSSVKSRPHRIANLHLLYAPPFRVSLLVFLRGGYQIESFLNPQKNYFSPTTSPFCLVPELFAPLDTKPRRIMVLPSLDSNLSCEDQAPRSPRPSSPDDFFCGHAKWSGEASSHDLSLPFQSHQISFEGSFLMRISFIAENVYPYTRSLWYCLEGGTQI